MVGMTTLHNRYLQEIKALADVYSFTIPEDETIEYIKNYIQDHNLKNILEIGTGIGYTSICMALIDDDINIISIEKDERRYLQAIKNIKKFFLENRIILIYNDALKVSLDQKFDMIFIDATKGKYINNFNRYKKYLNDNGMIITNNISFKDIDKDTDIEKNNISGLVNKIKGYVDFLKENIEYTTEFIDIGEGIAISIKK